LTYPLVDGVVSTFYYQKLIKSNGEDLD